MAIRHGNPPFLECSSKGMVCFSAFHARLRKYGSRSIEELYQAAKVFEDGVTGLSWREAKGKYPVNLPEVQALYSRLWDEYIEENPNLVFWIITASGFSDIFGKPNHVCQATELFRIQQSLLKQYEYWYQQDISL
jgi:hypothetical protein